jgi:hypothetical protein
MKNIETVSLEEAKKLSRKGWIKGQTIIKYEKDNNSSFYKRTDKKSICFGYDAPNILELQQMCNKVGYDYTVQQLSLSELVTKLLLHCKLKKITLHEFRI